MIQIPELLIRQHTIITVPYIHGYILIVLITCIRLGLTKASQRKPREIIKYKKSEKEAKEGRHNRKRTATTKSK